MFKLKNLGVFILMIIFLWVHLKTISPILPTPLIKRYQLCKIDVLNQPTLLNEFNDWTFTRWYPNKVNIDYDSTLLKTYIEFTFDKLPNTIYERIIQCKTIIPSGILYQARNLKALIQVNQPINISTTFYRVGQGPHWDPTEITSEKVDKPILLTQPLDTMYHGGGQWYNRPKITWLSGDYESTVFIFNNYDQSKKLILRIYDVYLE